MAKASAKTEAVSDSVTPLERKCMRDRIRDVITARVMDGTYAPGERLIEMNLAHEFNVSQAPVREALRELEAGGLVESQRYRGTRVRALNASELLDFLEMRAVIEERSAQLIIPCNPLLLEKLESALTGMRKAAKNRNPSIYASEVIQFHRLIVEGSGNRVFLQTWDQLQPEVRIRVAAMHVEPELEDYAVRHEAILAALQNGDGRRAGKLLRSLIENYMATLQPLAAAGKEITRRKAAISRA
jgi:DNA-binding GntR family transcriptional regulator